MGIAERKEREKEELRDRILSTAARQFVENGFEATSMRSIAREIEYSPTTIYLYFKDKNELMFHLSLKGFQLFFEHLNKAMVISDPMERIKKLGEKYIEFALNNPDLYELMFILKAPIYNVINEEEKWKQGKMSHDTLTETVKDCIAAGHFKGMDPDIMALTIWSFVHGLVSMDICKRMIMYEENKREFMIQNALIAFNKMLEGF